MNCGALLIVVDTVATLAGIPLDVDRQRIDICFSGTQKAISAPPGMAPITVSPAARSADQRAQDESAELVFRSTTTMNMWGSERAYHHTPPISLIYGLHEALRIVFEEGLEARWERHKQNQQALIAGLEAMGLESLSRTRTTGCSTVTPSMFPPALMTLKRAQTTAQSEFNIEISGGFGPIEGQDVAHRPDGIRQPARTMCFCSWRRLEKVLLDQGMHCAAAQASEPQCGAYAQDVAVAAGHRK